MTLPDEPNTLPNRTEVIFICGLFFCKACSPISANRLLAPITLVGLIALSVEIMTKSFVP